MCREQVLAHFIGPSSSSLGVIVVVVVGRRRGRCSSSPTLGNLFGDLYLHAPIRRRSLCLSSSSAFLALKLALVTPVRRRRCWRSLSTSLSSTSSLAAAFLAPSGLLPLAAVMAGASSTFAHQECASQRTVTCLRCWASSLSWYVFLLLIVPAVLNALAISFPHSIIDGDRLPDRHGGLID